MAKLFVKGLLGLSLSLGVVTQALAWADDPWAGKDRTAVMSPPFFQHPQSQVAPEYRAEVIVSNLGTVFSGGTLFGQRDFDEKVALSKAGAGRVAGESVVLLVGGNITAAWGKRSKNATHDSPDI